MARKRIMTSDGGADVEFNMTPMIDCTFQLIIFFILASTVLSPALSDLELHRPKGSVAQEEKERDEDLNRVIVNIVSRARDEADAPPELSAQALQYEVGGQPIDVGDIDRLVELFKSRMSASKGKDQKPFCVEIRSDHRVNYDAVKPVMKAASLAEIHRMNLTALTASGAEE